MDVSPIPLHRQVYFFLALTIAWVAGCGGGSEQTFAAYTELFPLQPSGWHRIEGALGVPLVRVGDEPSEVCLTVLADTDNRLTQLETNEFFALPFVEYECRVLQSGEDWPVLFGSKDSLLTPDSLLVYGTVPDKVEELTFTFESGAVKPVVNGNIFVAELPADDPLTAVSWTTDGVAVSCAPTAELGAECLGPAVVEQMLNSGNAS